MSEAATDGRDPIPCARFSAVDTLAITYLTLPVGLFMAFFLRSWIAVPASLALLWLILRITRETDFGGRPRPSDAVVALVAVGWVVLAGLLPPLAQASDWVKHYAIINLLAAESWPPVHDGEHLRYTLGYYLVPGAIIKAIGAVLPDWTIAAWTAVGAFLALRLATSAFGRTWQVLCGATIFVLFSGLDIIGTLITGFRRGPLGHLEWWADFGQISSQMTSMMWTTQHALPAWIGVGLLLRPSAPRLVRYGPLLMVATTFWSLFAAIGLLPFALLKVWEARGRGLWSPEAAVGLALGVPVAAYLASGSGVIPHFPIWTLKHFTWTNLILLDVLEWGLVVALLAYLQPARWPLLAAVALTLFVLPLYKVGAAHDLLMRGSAPAVAVLCILCAEELVARPPSRVALLLAAVVAIGTLTGLHEVMRGFREKRWVNYQRITFDMSLAGLKTYRYQYFVAERPFVVRDNGGSAVAGPAPALSTK